MGQEDPAGPIAPQAFRNSNFDRSASGPLSEKNRSTGLALRRTSARRSVEFPSTNVHRLRREGGTNSPTVPIGTPDARPVTEPGTDRVELTHTVPIERGEDPGCGISRSNPGLDDTLRSTRADKHVQERGLGKLPGEREASAPLEEPLRKIALRDLLSELVDGLRGGSGQRGHAVEGGLTEGEHSLQDRLSHCRGDQIRRTSRSDRGWDGGTRRELDGSGAGPGQ